MSAHQAAATQVDLRRLARGGILNFGGAVASALSNFALIFVVARTLPPATAGQFFAATSVFILLMGLGQLGARSALVYFIARLPALGFHSAVDFVLRLALVPVALTCTLLGGVLWFAAGSIADLAINGAAGATADFLRTLALFLPVAAVMDTLLGGTRGFGDMRPTVFIDKMFRPVAQVAVVAGVALLGASSAVVWGWALPYLPALVASGMWLSVLRTSRTSAARLKAPAFTEQRALRREYWLFAAPRAVSGLFQVALQRLDIIIVAALLGPIPAVMYVAATRLVALGAFGAQAIAMAVEPQVAAHFAHGERAAVNDVYRTSTTWLILMTWPMYCMAIAFAPTLLSVFGSEYQQAAAVLVILSGASMLSSGCGLVDVMLTMAGRATWILGNVSVALIVNVGLNLVLVPRLGIAGAAWAWAAAIAVNNLLPLAQLRLSMAIDPFGTAPFSAALVAVVAFVPVSLVTLLIFGQGVPALGISLATGATAYLVLVWRARQALHVHTLTAALRSV